MPKKYAAFFIMTLGAFHAKAEQCDTLIDGEFVVDKTLRISALPDDADFSPRAKSSSKNIEAILCFRESLVPEKNDFKVLLAGIPLGISKGDRILWLYLEDGLFGFRDVGGPLSKEEMEGLEAWFNKSEPKVNHAISVNSGVKG